MPQPELLPHLFRTEYSKIVAVLCRRFGFTHMEAAEDIASEAFLAAAETWPYKGLPENPVAWLYTVAKNKALNFRARENLYIDKVSRELQREETTPWELDLSDSNITDSQLQMMFAVCHPSLPPDAQVALALRVLCGFGIEEIANAFLSNKETINKRLHRAKEKLRSGNIAIEFPDATQLKQRSASVLTTLYLLFNEGYYPESGDAVLRKDLCLEAMRLTRLLLDDPRTVAPEVHALMALMCFHASRFDARVDHAGEPILYQDQDESLWNQELIARGTWHLHESRCENVSKYHLEAGIAFWQTKRIDSDEKWNTVLGLYNQLLILEYSPIAALNRTYALSKVSGTKVAIDAAEKLRLETSPYYFALLGELYKDSDPDRALENFKRALQVAKTPGDRNIIMKKRDALANAR
jgi:RNA polymerase sigma-70 factor (ECF subfamily)